MPTSEAVEIFPAAPCCSILHLKLGIKLLRLWLVSATDLKVHYRPTHMNPPLKSLKCGIRRSHAEHWLRLSDCGLTDC